MDSDHSRWIGTHRLVAHLLRRMAGMPSGPGAESSFISDIASTILSGVSTGSVSLLMRGGTLKVGIVLLEQFGSLKTEQN